MRFWNLSLTFPVMAEAESFLVYFEFEYIYRHRVTRVFIHTHSLPLADK